MKQEAWSPRARAAGSFTSSLPDPPLFPSEINRGLFFPTVEKLCHSSFDLPRLAWLRKAICFLGDHARWPTLQSRPESAELIVNGDVGRDFGMLSAYCCVRPNRVKSDVTFTALFNDV